MLRTREAMEHARQRGMLNRFLLVFNDRGMEWFSAYVMLGWGVTLIMPGDTLAGPQYSAFARFGLTEEFWAWAFSGAGIARIVALYINGNWPKSPHIRMLGSMLGAVSWAQLSYLITISTYGETGVAAPGTMLYAGLAFVDIIGIARAAFDARYYRT